MIITTDMLNKKVPIDLFPTRFDSATDLYTYTKKGLVLYNVKPDTWNTLYPFFQVNNKFTMNIDIDNKNITYKDLLDIYEEVYNREYVIKKGFNEDKRKQVLIDEFNETFGVSGTKIGVKLDSHYELKFSKSKKVYTLYYIESYVANEIDDVDKLLQQTVFAQEFLDLNNNILSTEINGTIVTDSISCLNHKNKRDMVKENIL